MPATPIQTAKAGILEIADVIVVNKADLPQAAAHRGLSARAAASHASPPPAVLTTVASSGEGIAALADAIAACGTSDRRREGASRGTERRLRHRIVAAAAAHVERDGADCAELAELAADMQSGKLTVEGAAKRLLAALVGARQET